jgi:hypothetical protein
LQEIDFLNVNTDLMEQVIHFCYTGTYQRNSCEDILNDTQAINACLRTYVIARELEVSSLEKQVLKVLSKLFSYDWIAPVSQNVRGWDAGCLVVQRPKIEGVLSFVEEAMKIWTKVGGVLTGLVTATCHFYAGEFRENDVFDNIPSKLPELAVGMVQKVGKLTKDWNASGPTGGQACAMKREHEGSVTATCIVGECQNSGHQFVTDVVFEEDAGDEAEEGAEEEGAEDATEDTF